MASPLRLTSSLRSEPASTEWSRNAVGHDEWMASRPDRQLTSQLEHGLVRAPAMSFSTDSTRRCETRGGAECRTRSSLTAGGHQHWEADTPTELGRLASSAIRVEATPLECKRCASLACEGNNHGAFGPLRSRPVGLRARENQTTLDPHPLVLVMPKPNTSSRRPLGDHQWSRSLAVQAQLQRGGRCLSSSAPSSRHPGRCEQTC